MENVRFLYNPRSGGKRRHRQLEAALAELHKVGVRAVVVETRSSAAATAEARQAVVDGCDTVFACGGDGTIHDVIQGLAHTPVALAIVPLGTANALAHDLGIPLDPVAAVRCAVGAKTRRIDLGRVEYQGLNGTPAECYFTVAAGVGVDAHLFYRLQSGLKQRLGMAAYYAKAWHLWMTYRMQAFSVEYCEPGGTPKAALATELLAVRIRNFGGAIRELAPGAGLHRGDMRLVICRSARRSTYLAYVLRGLVGAQWQVKGVDLVHAHSAACTESTAAGDKIYVEADGELLGTIPARFSMVQNALTLLAPGVL